jgi:hypothetical protein
MGFEIYENRIGIPTLSLLCDLPTCRRDVECSPLAAFIIPAEEAGRQHWGKFYVACSPECAVGLVDEYNLAEWRRVPLIPPIAELIAAGRYLPREIDVKSYLASMHSIMEHGNTDTPSEE